MRRFPSRQACFWILNSLVWLLILGVGLIMSRTFIVSKGNFGTFLIIRSLAGFCLTTALHFTLRRPFFANMPQVKRWMSGWMVCLAFCILATPLLYPIHVRFSMEFHEILALIVPRVFCITVWLIMYFGIQAGDQHLGLTVRQLKLDKARLSEELRMLQAQVSPHFLFNSLNAVVANKDDAAKVVDVTESLAEFLRFSLRQTKPLDRLGVELDALEQYLCVQQHRFGERLACSVEYDPAARGTLVPTLIVQPLLENAINYGAAPADQVLQIRVVALCDAGRLHVKVHNTGEWLTPDPLRSSGTGLANLRRRLHLIYGDAASLAVSHEGGWVTVLVDLPMTPPTL